jgi:hypothetical protein
MATSLNKNTALTPQQHKALCVLMDTFCPSLDDGEIASVIAGLDWRNPPKIEEPQKAMDFFKISATEFGMPDALELLFSKNLLSWEETFNFKLVLDMLSSRAGSAALCSSNPLKGSFIDLPRKDRELLLSKMSSRLYIKR